MLPTPEALWRLSDTELSQLLDSGTLKPLTSSVRFYAPSFSYYNNKYFCSNTKDFPTVSVTGNICKLGCRQCGGKVLKTMYPATTPRELWEFGVGLKQKDGKGILISGGCLSDGSVPLDGFVSTLSRLKLELGLTVFVHTGIISEVTAQALKGAGIDAALIDVIGSQETISKVCHLSLSVKEYAHSLQALETVGIPFVPHVIVGLNDGSLDGEYSALQMISKVNPSALVIIAFMPIPGTEMSKTPPPKPQDIVRVIAVARRMFPTTPLILGCMRPKGKSRIQTDILALKAGVDGIALPSVEAIDYVKRKSVNPVFSSFCCAEVYHDFV